MNNDDAPLSFAGSFQLNVLLSKFWIFDIEKGLQNPVEIDVIGVLLFADLAVELVIVVMYGAANKCLLSLGVDPFHQAIDVDHSRLFAFAGLDQPIIANLFRI